MVAVMSYFMCREGLIATCNRLHTVLQMTESQNIWSYLQLLTKYLQLVDDYSQIFYESFANHFVICELLHSQTICKLLAIVCKATANVLRYLHSVGSAGSKQASLCAPPRVCGLSASCQTSRHTKCSVRKMNHASDETAPRSENARIMRRLALLPLGHTAPLQDWGGV